ncbi:MAG TPA: TfoX/Sxy family protein [Longimicrobium sp.]|nr:TfoX/Sxy family protein [Longimicrobium sp.]
MSRKPTSELAKLRNLGEKAAQALNRVGIDTEAELREVGAVNAYRLMVLHGHDVSLNFLWAIEGALRGISWLDIPPADRARLKEELEGPFDARELLGLE